MKRDFFRYLPLLIAIGILCGSVGFFSRAEFSGKEEISIPQESHATEQKEIKYTKSSEKDDETLGVWVSYLSLDMSDTDRSENAWKNRVTEIMKNIRESGADTVVFHVRPFCDSIYKSDIFPTSHIITGKQGAEITYDPLEIAVKTAREQGLKFHAWINPLRVSLKTVPETLAENNPYMLWKDSNKSSYTFAADGCIYLNPAYPEVRKRIIDGAKEIIGRYEVDGLQIDDYFYPDGDSYDEKEYEDYCKNAGEVCLSKKEWRCENINMLVCGLYDAVHERKGCVFGISPQCNTDNDLKAGADVFKWCSHKGYADYICPQLYVSIDHPTAPYGELADKWRKMTTCPDVKLYFGLALYKVGTDADSGTWLDNENMIDDEMETGREKGADGFMLYSYEQLKSL